MHNSEAQMAPFGKYTHIPEQRIGTCTLNKLNKPKISTDFFAGDYSERKSELFGKQYLYLQSNSERTPRKICYWRKESGLRVDKLTS